MAADYKRPDEAAMQRILERYPYSPEGAIIRLAWLQGLSRKELNQLTWDQVDFANRVLLLPERRPHGRAGGGVPPKALDSVP